jgi:serine/threonine protein kinase
VRFGAYQTLVDLGRGGMADLYVAKAEPLLPDAPLLIVKTLRPPITEKRIEMFLDEARLGLLFDHPNVVRTFGVGQEAGRHYIAMEMLDGQPVDRLVNRVRLANKDDESVRTVFLWILAESLAGLHYAHELSSEGTPLQIVHRDFTPHNLFVTYDGRVKALDFGIAKAQGRISRTTTGEVKGKVRYMAPEQALGLRIDRRADVFSAGVILFELCGGAPLWKEQLPDREVFDDLVGGAYPVGLAGASTAINAILAKALARDASERYRTAAEMRSDLLAEIERRESIAGLAAKTTALMAELFADQRDRTAKMIAHAATQSAAQ